MHIAHPRSTRTSCRRSIHTHLPLLLHDSLLPPNLGTTIALSQVRALLCVCVCVCVCVVCVCVCVCVFVWLIPLPSAMLASGSPR